MTASETAKTLAFSAAQAAADKKAFAINLRDVTSKIALTDVFVIVSASNERQVHAVVDAVEERLIKEHDTRPLRREGKGGEQWVLLDYNEIVVHVFHQEARVFYGLDGLWKDCPEIEFVDQAEAERERRTDTGGDEGGEAR
ncbi:ribosome silencing factor [Glycomyces albidus]|uniref:Ribosomal silencing factor RsfS n=1 Tax=Glycomyces albidus TaxID=2656774 RepID=A0A6L5GF08_9ACTN|nr:ribosome silencing factor [Glycomyces albidus]MQM28171.1 ribosome silencing factor [Glycomyces albidus]